MLWTTDDETLGTPVTENKKNQNIINSTAEADSDEIDRNIENLLTIANLVKSKRPNSAKPKMSDLSKANFAKVIFLGVDFLTLGAKKTFIYLRKAFTKTLILRYFDLEYHIQIETNALEYAIGRVLSQMTLD